MFYSCIEQLNLLCYSLGIRNHFTFEINSRKTKHVAQHEVH